MFHRVSSFFSFLFSSSSFPSSSHRIGAVDKKYEEIEVVAAFYYACTSDFFRQLGCLPNVEKLKRPRASKQDRNRVEYLGRVDNSTAVKLDLSRFYGETLFSIVSCISENHRLILLQASIVHCNVVTIRQNSEACLLCNGKKIAYPGIPINRKSCQLCIRDVIDR